MKFITLILIICCVTGLEASTKDGKMENRKLVQVKIMGSEGSSEANNKVNEFLLLQKLSREDILDIKITRSSSFVTTMIIYQVNMEDK